MFSSVLIHHNSSHHDKIMSNPVVASYSFIKNSIDAEISKEEVLSLNKEIKHLRTHPVEEKELFAKLDMKPVQSVAIPTVYITDATVLDRLAKSKTGVLVASGSEGGLSFRRRGALGHQIVKLVLNAHESAIQSLGTQLSAWGVAPERCADPALMVVVEEIMRRSREVFMVTGGALASVNRFIKACPKKDRFPVTPPTLQETRRAYAWSGGRKCSSVDVEARCIADDGTGKKPVRIVPGADIGYPTLGKYKDSEALDVHKEIALQVRQQLLTCEGYEDAQPILLELETKHPEWFVHRGKTKTDVYKRQKVEDLALRFYVVGPGWSKLLMQMATQPFEEATRNILQEDTDFKSVVHDTFMYPRTAKGLSLARGGALRLVQCLDRHLQENEWSATTTGDDTWLNFRVPNINAIVMVSLDCSNFDLTQVAEVVRPLRLKVAEQLEYVDPVGAWIWRYLTMEPRLIAPFTIGTWKLNHCGASGTPLQSLINDMLMSVVLQRVIERLSPYFADYTCPSGVSHESEIQGEVSRVLRVVGHQLGLDIRIDQFELAMGVDTLYEALQITPFLYIGYNFWCNPGGQEWAYTWQDWPRACANLRYPTMPHEEDDTLFRIKEAIAAVGTIINLGLQPMRVFRTGMLWSEDPCMMQGVIDLVKRTLDKVATFEVPEMNGFHMSPFVGYELVAQKDALKSAVARAPFELWWPVMGPQPMLREERVEGDLEEGERTVALDTRKTPGKVLSVSNRRFIAGSDLDNFGKMPPIVKIIAKKERRTVIGLGEYVKTSKADRKASRSVYVLDDSDDEDYDSSSESDIQSIDSDDARYERLFEEQMLEAEAFSGRHTFLDDEEFAVPRRI